MSSPWVLVVDDDDDIRDTMMTILDQRGYVAAGAADGLDALEQIRIHGAPGIVLLDLRMPRMSGKEFVNAVHSDPLFLSSPKIKDGMLEFLRGQTVSVTKVAAPPMKFAPLRKAP